MEGYRNSTQIFMDILKITDSVGKDGIKPTSLQVKSNLSHKRFNAFIENLTGSELVNKIEFDGRRTFVITQKGKQYLESYQKFHNFAQTFGLEL